MRTARTELRVKKAVSMYVYGASWRDIAADMGYSSPDSARHHLMHRHRELWNEHYLPISAVFLGAGVETEAINCQLDFIRMECAEDVDKMAIAQKAAHSLLAHVAKLKGQRLHVDIDMKVRRADDELIRKVELAADSAAQRLRLAAGDPVA